MTNIPATNLNVRRLYVQGQEALEAKRQVREDSLRGVLRAGSSGCLHERRVYGECHRVAHLRWLGVDKSFDADRRLMLEAGEGNEDLWVKTLQAGWQGQVLKGLEVRRDTAVGPVLGTTDVILADAAGTQQVVLELKLVSALNSAILRHFHGAPDGKHLVQAACYMWLANLPAVLCYASRTDFATGFSAKKYGTYRIAPFLRLFYLTLRDGRLYYRDEFEADEVATYVTVDGIQAHYELVTKLAELGLGERPESAAPVAGAEAHYDRCKYCPYQSVCDRYEHDYPTWLDAAKQVAQEAL